MYSERGDTRNPITLATSSGRSIRPKGIRLPSGELLRRLAEKRALLLGYCRPHVRLHKAGAHAVHSNPVGSVGYREALGHADDHSLAGASPASDLGRRGVVNNGAGGQAGVQGLTAGERRARSSGPIVLSAPARACGELEAARRSPR
jgi:hypothetical protein